MSTCPNLAKPVIAAGSATARYPGAGVEKAVLGARADPAAQQGWTLLSDGPRLQIGQDTNRSKNLLRRCGGKQAQTK
jgi:hypothetical protein